MMEVPPKYQPVHDKAMRGKSRAAAIRAFCCMCVGWNGRLVAECTTLDCPLHPYRPGARRRLVPQERGDSAAESTIETHKV